MPIGNNFVDYFPFSIDEIILCDLVFLFVADFKKALSMGNDQEPYENVTRVFWIKIELKDNYGKDTQDLGDIRDVISGSKSSIRDLLDIIDFIVPYMQQMGIRVSWFWRLALRIKTIIKTCLKK